MQDVGVHLESSAIEKGSPFGDDFARSAFNRYYYSCFLTVRAWLIQNYKWNDNNSHSALPDVFSGLKQNQLKKKLKKAQKLSDNDSIKNFSLAIRSTNNIVNILNKGRAMREKADYRPELKVQFVDNTFSIDNIKVSEAQNWMPEIRKNLNNIETAFRESGELLE